MDEKDKVRARIDVNRATAEELGELKGIGEVLAKRIVEFRKREGRFLAVADLRRIDGVTPNIVADLGDTVTVGHEVEGGGESSMRIRVTLEPGRGKGSFEGFTVSLAGARSADGSEIPFVATAMSGATGEVELELPDFPYLTSALTLSVSAPDGTRVHREPVALDDLRREMSVRVDPVVYASTHPNEDPAAGLPTKIRGRVIDESGRQVGGDVQVVLWATTVEDAEPQDFIALVVASTDDAGHFSGPFPVGSYRDAYAAVAVDGGSQDQPIHLTDDGRFPDSVILVVELPEASPLDESDDDCDCHVGPGEPPRSPDKTDLARADGTFSADRGGRCVDFTKPDRTLEEFSYSYAVRTTEPEIRGFTLDEPPRVNLGSVIPFLPAFTGPRGVKVDPESFGRSDDARLIAEKVDLDSLSSVDVDARTLRALSQDPDGFSVLSLAKSADRSRHLDLQRVLGRTIARRPPSRERLACDNVIDWDDEPTIYQACTIAHGHLLRFKQEWVADGYSMGNLLYSLPLAPGQQKLISVLDWERRESARRSERLRRVRTAGCLRRPRPRCQ